MQRLTDEHLFRNHGDLSTVPAAPPLRVAQGEPFLIETADTGNRRIRSEADAANPNGPMAGNPSTGPVYVEGIRAGEVIAVTIEALSVVGHCVIEVGENAVLPPDRVEKREDFVAIADGVAHFPGGLSAPVRPMYGCFGCVPASPVPEPWHHGGNMDIPDVCAGHTVHLRCERDGAWFACGDGHAVQGDGEINGFSLEVSLLGQLRVERSRFQDLSTILIETPETYITVGIEADFPSSIQSATVSMSELLAAARGIAFLEAYQLASHVADLRLGAVWPMWSRKQRDIPIPACLHLGKEHFE